MRPLSVVWAVIGVVVMLAYAVYRLSHFALEAIYLEMTALQWLLLVANCGFMAYSEGYKGFQLSFSPRFAARVKYIKDRGRGIELLLSPFFCFGYFGTTKAKQIVALVLTVLLVTIVSFMRYVPQPWRGIIDAGVVVGLSWGIISLLVCVYKQLKSEEFIVDPQVPSSGLSQELNQVPSQEQNKINT